VSETTKSKESGNNKSGSSAKSTKTTTTAAKNGGQAESTEKVERIRDLIFGQQIRDYSQKFDVINKDLTRLQGLINRLTDEVREQERSFTQKLREQEQTLTTQIQEQDRRQTQQHRELDQRLTQQIQDFDRTHSQNTQELWQAVRELEDTMRSELRQTAHELDELKMDRFTLGELLIKLGGDLKQTKPEQEAVDLLEQIDSQLGHELE